MNILVTGATGFIGSRLLELAKRMLDKEDRLILYTSKEIEGYVCILHNNYSCSKEDFLKAGICRIDRVIHLGHFLAETHKGENVVLGNLSTINNTLALLNSLPSIPISFVYCSSMAVYGTHRPDALDEASSLQGDNLYAVSKIMIEMLLEEWAKENGAALQILRLSHIYGPKDKREYTIPIWLNAAKRGEAVKLYANPSMYRNCLYIDDCCRGILNALKLERSEGVINLVSSHNATMLEIAELCREISENKKDVEINIERCDLEKEIGLRFKDNDKCRRLFGEEQLGLKEGLMEEFAYYEEHSMY